MTLNNVVVPNVFPLALPAVVTFLLRAQYVAQTTKPLVPLAKRVLKFLEAHMGVVRLVK